MHYDGCRGKCLTELWKVSNEIGVGVGKSLLIHQRIPPPNFSTLLQCLSDMYGDLCNNFYAITTAILYKITIKYQCIEKSNA